MKVATCRDIPRIPLAISPQPRSPTLAGSVVGTGVGTGGVVVMVDVVDVVDVVVVWHMW